MSFSEDILCCFYYINGRISFTSKINALSLLQTAQMDFKLCCAFKLEETEYRKGAAIHFFQQVQFSSIPYFELSYEGITQIEVSISGVSSYCSTSLYAQRYRKSICTLQN